MNQQSKPRHSDLFENVNKSSIKNLDLKNNANIMLNNWMQSKLEKQLTSIFLKKN